MAQRGLRPTGRPRAICGAATAPADGQHALAPDASEQMTQPFHHLWHQYRRHQAAPVALIREAGGNGARLVVIDP